MKNALVPLAALAFATGCMVAEYPYDPMALDPERYGMLGNFRNVVGDGVRPVGARLAGDVGPAMRGLDSEAGTNGVHDDGFTNLEVVVSNERGAAMAYFDIEGGIDHPALQVGERHRFGRFSTREGGEGQLFVSGIVCSGNGGYGNWTYDAPLESVEVQVEATDNPDVRRYHFTTVHDGDTATGYVDVVVPN